MKTLYVKDVLGPIRGVLIRGSGDQAIRHAAEHPTQIKQQHTLLFDRYDQHLLRGAWTAYPTGVVVTQKPELFLNRSCRWTVIKVESVEEAYWEFVKYYRELWHIPVIGITGTCGKTTVKEMITHILSGSMRVQSTYKTYNGLVYNLRYLLGIDEQTGAAVMEMKVACPGDLLHTCRVFQPQIGIITKIGIDHLEHCGTQENYLREKARLIEGLHPQGVLILNGDDEQIQKMDRIRFQGKILTFGKKTDADYMIEDIHYQKEGMSFTFSVRGKTFSAYVHGFGEHTVYNALASLVASRAVGVKIRTAIKRLATYRQLEAHLELRSGIRGCKVLDDTWSSNPTSAEAALKVLSEFAKGKKTVAIMGRIGMLGEHTEMQHKMLGEKVVEYQIDTLITIDPTADFIGQQAIEMGMDPGKVISCHSPEEVYKKLKALVDRDSFVLIKTSMMDRIDRMKKLIIKEGDPS